MNTWLVLNILGWSMGAVYFFRPQWVAKRGETPEKLQSIMRTGLFLLGAFTVFNIIHPFILSGALGISSKHRITPTIAWNLFMGACALVYAVVGLLWFRKPEKFANRVISAREIRRFGILMWLLVALYAIAYLL
jgi:hypothetical protein